MINTSCGSVYRYLKQIRFFDRVFKLTVLAAC